MLPVTSVAAVALAALLFMLTVNVVRQRQRERVVIGTGSETLARAIRAHGNFCETVPLVLILLALAELNGAPDVWLGAVAATFVLGRVAHAYSLTRREIGAGPPRFAFRIIGMATTFAALTLLGGTILVMLVLGR